ncbi:MAG: ZIP family metal transporter [Chloroflexi bacterium]|nr:ZIP family metal transporter [Chloroflexota bacterium]
MVYLLAVLAGLADVVGGLLPFYSRTRNINMRYILAFAAGTVIAAAFFELLPEANVEKNWLMLGLGFFVYYLIEKGLELHACGETECEARGISWITVLGMASDNIIDGLGIGVGFAINSVLGVLITVAVIVHEVPQGMATTLIMKDAGYKLNRILPMLIFAGVMYPIGTAVSGFVPDRFREMAIAFVAGVFIYVGAAALLGEAHKRFNLKVVFTFVLGSLVALGLRLLE